MQDIQPYKRPLAAQPLQAGSQAEPKLPMGAPEPLLPAKFKLPASRKRIRFIWLIVGAVIFVALLGIAAASVWWYMNALSPLSTSSRRVTVVIASGSNPSDIADELQSDRVIKSAAAFYWYAKLHNDLGKLQAGTYLLSPTQSVAQIISQIVTGKVDTYAVTILPGKTLAQIKLALIQDGFAAADIDAAFAQQYDSPLLKDKPASVNLEGYIFPDTYQITSQTTVNQLLQTTFATFYTRLQAEDLPQALAAKGFNLHQAVTLASVIEQEASNTPDRRQIAQVFEKRLSINMVLGSDVTFIYGAKQLGVAPSPTLDSPYNTRINPGLPPGAISNFTMDAIEAVASPAPGNYLYFVAGDDGTVHYASTEAEHEANVAKYCIKLCQ